MTARELILMWLDEKMVWFLDAMNSMSTQRDIPNISWNTAYFLRKNLSQLLPKNVLEIGTANGFSTMNIALSCPEDTHIFGIEFSRHAFEELRHNLSIFHILKTDQWTRSTWGDREPAHFPHKVTSDIFQEHFWNFSLYFWDAREILPFFNTWRELAECISPKSRLTDIPQVIFDCIFIDGAFRMTREFFDLSYPLLSPNGLIIIDDAIKFRWKMNHFHEYLEERGIPYELVYTDEDDWVMLIKKEHITQIWYQRDNGPPLSYLDC